MTIPIQIPDELARRAEQQGVEVAEYVARILADAAAAKPLLPPSPRLTKEELAECFDALAQFSSQIPALPDSAFTRESIYQDHD